MTALLNKYLTRAYAPTWALGIVALALALFVLARADSTVQTALIVGAPTMATVIYTSRAAAKAAEKKLVEIAGKVDGQMTALNEKVDESRLAAELAQAESAKLTRILVEMLEERGALKDEILRVRNPDASTPLAVPQPPVAITEGGDVIVKPGNERGEK